MSVCQNVNQCCPEPADITITSNNISVSENSIEFTIGAEAGDQRLITLQVVDSDGEDVAGRYAVKLWWVDDDDAPNTLSIDYPDTPGWQSLDAVTDATGEYQFTVGDTAVQTWYLVVQFGSTVYISSAISFA
jgi:hypothetical protein